MENEVNPFTTALEYTKTLDFWLVATIPLLLLIVAVVIYFFLYRIRKKQEIKEIQNLENLKDGDVPLDDDKDELEGAWIEPEDDGKSEAREDDESTLFEEEIEKWRHTKDSEVDAAPDQAEEEIQETAESLGEPVAQEVREIKNLKHSSWLNRLKQGLSNTRTGLQRNLSILFGQNAKIDDSTLESLHEILYRADVGPKTADTLVAHLKNHIRQNPLVESSWETVRGVLTEKITNIFKESFAGAESIKEPSQGPLVILIVGVNGVGKTTSIGKLASHFLAQGKSVLLCAGDTFRAAAIEQLSIWGERLNIDVIAHKQGGDPAAVAYDAVKAAIARKKDVLLIDTAGRLHNKDDLMRELAKITKVIRKDLPEAPHETWLVIDATTGQNAFQQVSAFREVTALSGLIVTKLDGTAKGGVVIGVSHQFKIPIRFIGVGEKAADLQPFVAEEFTNSLFNDNDN